MTEPLPDFQECDPIDWMERNVQLDYGYFKRENHPLIVEPLRAAAQKRGGYVGLIGSVQHIKTLCAQLVQLYGLHTSPCNAAHYDLTGDALKEFSDDKFVPLIDNTETITRLIPDQPYRRTKFYTSTPYGYIRLLSAGIMANRNSKTLERITADESWAYRDDEGWLEQIHDRQSSFTWQWQMFLPSSGQTAGSQLDELWKKSTQRTWHVKCDCCGEEIPYIWKLPPVNDKVPPGGMRYASTEEVTGDDGMIDWVKLRESVYYQCQLCEGRMEWSAADQDRRNLAGRYVQMNLNGDPDIEFFHYNAMVHVPWPELVTKWKEATIARSRGDLSKLENFIRKQLAEPWSETDYISADVQKTASGGYNLGEEWGVPGQFIFCCADVQKDSFYFVIRSFAIVQGVLKSRLLERGHVITVGEIKYACDKWKIPQHPLGSGGACRVFLDGNYNTTVVQRIALENNWMVFRGDAAKDYMNQDGMRRIYSDLKVVDAFDGTSHRQGSRVGQFYFSQQSARNRLSIIRSLKDHEGNPVWTHADDAGEEYEKQINSWAKIAKKKPDGSIFYDWICRNREDHYFDAEKMAMVCASMCKNLGIERVEKG
ncbi:hypothetical protein P8625_06 [Verrucomicrobia phage P8625]|uniref:terminase large subunit n=1 Tax=Verrucomicrobia phage P8625 TaxID=1636271 RepID=UPI0005FEB619|nr:terminase large subunit [Verrucomicrobia phage P8625]AKA60257.1 hypothetical protein P8625_06 [Verrucomicrobia phage P8625]